jgi:hypothetical protein
MVKAMEPKLTILLLIISTIIVLSHERSDATLGLWLARFRARMTASLRRDR